MSTGNWSQADVDAIAARRGQRTSLTPSEGAGIYTAPPKGKSKYRNVRTLIGTDVFDSKKEAQYWVLLRARQELGEILNLQRQVTFDLCAPSWADGPSEECIVIAHYVADFVYDVPGEKLKHVVDVKGHRTREYLLKKKWLFLQSGIDIEEI